MTDETDLSALGGIDAIVKQPASKKTKNKVKKETTNEETTQQDQELSVADGPLLGNELLSTRDAVRPTVDGDSDSIGAVELPSEDTKEETRKEVHKKEAIKQEEVAERPKTTAELIADAARNSRIRQATHRAKQTEMSRWHRGHPPIKKK